MKKNKFNIIYLLFMLVMFVACSEDGLVDENGDGSGSVAHGYTLTTNNTYQFIVGEDTVAGDLRMLNSLNNNLYLSLDLGFGSGGFILPKKTGNFKSGYNFGPANGTEGNNAYLNVFLTYKGEKYYAYSSHAYGYREQDLIPDSECRITIKKFEGDYKIVEIWSFSGYGQYTLFMGDVEVLFEGTFKTKDGSKSIDVKKGQIKAFDEPNGTTVRYPEN